MLSNDFQFFLLQPVCVLQNRNKLNYTRSKHHFFQEPPLLTTDFENYLYCIQIQDPDYTDIKVTKCD